MERAQLLLKRYHWVLTLLVLLLLANLLGRTTNLLIRAALPRAPIAFERAVATAAVTSLRNKLQPRSYYDIINTRNLFNSAPPAVTTAPTAEQGPPVGALTDRAKVRGTIVGETSSMAMIEVLATKEVGVYLEGDLIVEGAEIIKIQEDGVVYRQRGEEGFLPMEEEGKATATRQAGNIPPIPGLGGTDEADSDAVPPGEGIQQISETEFAIDARELENQLANINQLILQARVVPNFTAGKIDGFKIFAIKPDSIFRKLGLRNGDVLMSINGVVLDNPQKGLQVFQDLQGKRNFAIDLRRRNENMTYQYDVR